MHLLILRSACKSVPRFCFSTVWDWSVDYFLDYSICCFAHKMSKKKKKSPRWLRRMSLVSSTTRRSLETRTGALVLLRITPKIEKSHPTWYQIKQKKAHRCPKSHLPPVVQHDTLLFFAGPCRYICSERRRVACQPAAACGAGRHARCWTVRRAVCLFAGGRMRV